MSTFSRRVRLPAGRSMTVVLKLARSSTAVFTCVPLAVGNRIWKRTN